MSIHLQQLLVLAVLSDGLDLSDLHHAGRDLNAVEHLDGGDADGEQDAEEDEEARDERRREVDRGRGLIVVAAGAVLRRQLGRLGLLHGRALLVRPRLARLNLALALGQRRVARAGNNHDVALGQVRGDGHV